MQQNVNFLPAKVKPALPTPFIGKMDGVSISRFVHQLDNYYKNIGLTDDTKMG